MPLTFHYICAMRFEIVEINGIAVAEIFADGVILASLDDGLDMLGECMGAGVSRLVIKEENISPNFFDLGTKLAGDVLQKFTQYMVKLAIVMDFGHVEKPSLRDFIP